MNRPTYKEQFDKLTAAYINNEVDRSDNWAVHRALIGGGNGVTALPRGLVKASDHHPAIDPYNTSPYNMAQICLMEEEFLNAILLNGGHVGGYSEDVLFHAFEATLEILKEIHISWGEQVETQVFTKRQLQHDTI